MNRQASHSSPVNHRGVKVRDFRILILFQMRRVVAWRRLRYSWSRRPRYSGPDARRGAGSCIANFLTRSSPLLQKKNSPLIWENKDLNRIRAIVTASARECWFIRIFYIVSSILRDRMLFRIGATLLYRPLFIRLIFSKRCYYKSTKHLEKRKSNVYHR